MAREKKSADINRNYPILGFRVSKSDKDDFDRNFEALLMLLRNQPEYYRINLKKNALFLRALELGIQQIKAKKSLA